MEITDDAIERIKTNFLLPDTDDQTAYNAGYDCGLNGATLENCHFSLFSSPAARDAWNQGHTDGKAGKKNKYVTDENQNDHHPIQ